MKLLKDLCLLPGVSGNEAKVRNFILNQIKDHCRCEVDSVGNIIAFKEGRNKPKNKVAFFAHMDEVGLIINKVDTNGFLKFDTVGSVDAALLLAKRVLINDIYGVIGVTPIHLLSEEEQKKPLSVDKMYIDIGAKSKDEALKYVSLGDTASFDSEFVYFGDNKVKAKAIDDRFGCAILIEMIKSELLYDSFFVFTVNEEIGGKGAAAAVKSVMPDYAFVIEATTADDTALVDKTKRVCEQKKGAVLSFCDGSVYYDDELLKKALKAAEDSNISAQLKNKVAGGTDAGAIVPLSMAKTLSISAPCRYIHSPACVLDMSDYKSVFDLCVCLLSEVEK